MDLRVEMNRAGLMTDPEKVAAESLTGVWNGVFRQRLVGSVNFTATLIESGNAITGSTHEPCIQFFCPRRTHLATLAGYRQGRTVSFMKSYDPPGFGYDTVAYRGELNGDATEIAGVWTIGSGFSGEFVMTRPGRNTKARERKKLATVSS
jgi:hypothetical protein